VPRVSERALLFLVGAVQFVNVLDFMMVMPLGPDFAVGLGIPASRLGLVGGAYTAAAAVAGLASATFLDRFDRRRALAVTMLGLVVGTVMGGFARGLGTMLIARCLAGAFGGPATALSIAIVADTVPAERRGKALGKVMGAFTVASVFGVPAGLELARLGGWRTPFFAVAGLGLVVAGAAIVLMPPLRAHLEVARRAPPTRGEFLRRPVALLSLAATASSMASGFAIIPNIASWVQFNLGLPRERLGLMYMAGGAVTFFTLRVAGRMIDRYGAPAVGALGSALYVAVLGLGFAWPPAGVPIVPLFVGFMVGNSTRNVATTSLATRVPAPQERARFLSAQSAVQHLAAAAGAALSTRLLAEGPDGRIAGMRGLALGAAGVALLLPLLLRAVAAHLGPASASTASGKGAFLAAGDSTHGG
jgi:predicted MFS family arabinose efflux permease